MRELRYYIDPTTEQPHIYGHNVEEAEVEDVLSRPAEDGSNRNGSRIAIGQTRAGRYLKVVYAPDDDGIGIFVITAYDLRGAALTAFRRRMRRRGKR